MSAVAVEPGNDDVYDPEAEIARLVADIASIKAVDETTQDAARALIGREVEIRNKLDAMRKVEVEPHLEGQRRVNGFYNGLIDTGKAAAAVLRAMINAYLDDLEEKRKAAARAAIAEAIKAEEAAVEAEDPFTAYERLEEAKRAARIANSAVKIADKPVALRGGGMKALGRRTTYTVHLDGDGGDLVGHFASHADVVEFCRVKAEKLVKAAKGDKCGIPGIRVETSSAV